MAQAFVYINFVDFEKAIDYVHRGLKHILRAYGIPQCIVQIIKSFYHNFTCSMGSSSLNFQSKSRQAYIRDVPCL